MARGMCPLDPALPETLSQVKGHWPSSPWPTEGAHWPDLVKLLPLPHRLPMAASSSGPCLFSVCGTAPVNNRESANQGKAPPPHAPQLPTQKLLSSAFPVSVGQGFRAHRSPCFQVPSNLKARSMGPAKEHRRQDWGCQLMPSPAGSPWAALLWPREDPSLTGSACSPLCWHCTLTRSCS